MNYSELLNNYNRLLAYNKSIEDNIANKELHWNELEKEFRLIDDKARKLCEIILSKDKREMSLGNDNTSWYSQSTPTLIERTIKSFEDYNADRADLLARIMHTAEDRRNQIESLKDQLSQMINSPNNVEIKTKDINSEQNTNTSSLIPNKDVQQAVNNNSVDLIVEDDNDISSSDIKFLDEIKNYEENLQQVTTSSIPTIPSTEKIKKRQSYNKEKQKNKAYMIDLSEIENQMSECGWLILEAIGKKGISIYGDIEQYAKDNGDYTDSRVRTSMTTLTSLNLVCYDMISTALVRKFYVYRLSQLGERLYKDKFKETPTVSQLEEVIAEHDNATHGYGILEVANILESSNNFKSINYKMRHSPISLGKNISYIPDIVTKTEKQTFYFEYECGHHTQNDFNAKCNKMCKITRLLNFVVPNRSVLDKKLIPQVERWIESRGKNGIDKNIKVRIVCTLSIGNNSLIEDTHYNVVYDMTKGKITY